MQSGAFIQLVLTLAAIASKMYSLMPDIQNSLALGWASAHRSLQVLSPSCASKLKPIGPRTDAVRSEIPASLQVTSRPREFDDATFEDLGISIARPTNVPNLAEETPTDSLGARTPSAVPEDDVSILVEDTVQWPSESVVTHISRVTTLNQDVDVNKLSAATSSTKRGRKSRPGGGVPIKQKRDEIDDIFGF